LSGKLQVVTCAARGAAAAAAVGLALVVAWTVTGGVGAAAAGGALVIVIDPGHDERANLETEPIGPGSATRKIKDGGGTHGAATGLREADLVLDVSLRLRTLLRRAGVRVVMTRTRTAGASMGNIARAEIANRAGAALFLRVHADGHPSSAVRGTHTLVPALRDGWTDDVHGASRRAAEIVQPELVRALGFPDRGVGERSDFTGFNWADVPAILVELGFMTNPLEDRQLARPEVRQRAALGLCRGTLRFVGLSPARCSV
jgi:N-acetylmuramoyl-L-alanine amidase